MSIDESAAQLQLKIAIMVLLLKYCKPFMRELPNIYQYECGLGACTVFPL